MGDLFAEAVPLPACPRGCLAAHPPGEACPRVLPPDAAVLNRDTPDETAFAIIPGEWASAQLLAKPLDPNRITYARLNIRDKGGALQFPVGITVRGATRLNDSVKWSHAIRFNPPGLAPVEPMLSARFIASAPTTPGKCAAAVPAKTYLGVESAAWKAIDACPCAAERYATFFGETARRTHGSANGVQIRTARAFRPKTTVGHGPEPPHAAFEPDAVVCGWCGARFEGPWAQLRYHQSCAPDAAMKAAQIQEAPRKRARIVHVRPLKKK